MIPISELKEGDSITSMYAVRRKETPREYRNKEGKYFFFTVGDKTGDIVVKFWGGADLNRTMETYGALKVGDVVEISGDVEFDRFDDRLVVRMSEGIHGIRFCSGSEYAVSDFLPASDKDLDALYSQLLERMSEIGDEHLRHLVSLFLNDEDFGPAYRSAPASMMHHHNYIGGLLEHTLNVVGLCDRV
ncbi:MAG: hypothetical protein KAT70_05950, partial [Thermoplasmata archaeon]|nr:hypothetical protein [Thermoplasmata archaeon]